MSPSNKIIDSGYDVPALDRYLDYVSVMTYDYHGQWDEVTGEQTRTRGTRDIIIITCHYHVSLSCVIIVIVRAPGAHVPARGRRQPIFQHGKNYIYA